MTTFTPPIAPSIDSAKETSIRVLKNEFGDGYTQRAANGLNSVKRVYNFVWQGLTQAQYDTIDTFLRTQKGYLAFSYTPPGDSTAILFTCDKWQQRQPAPGGMSLQATFEEQFDLS